MGQGTESCNGYDVDYNPYEENLSTGKWIMKNGQEISVEKMATSHIRNAISLCRRKAKCATFSCDAKVWEEWIDLFQSELLNRLTTTAKAKPEKAKAPVRGAQVERTCHCGAKYMVRAADINRGWGLSCSKSCAAKRRVRMRGR